MSKASEHRILKRHKFHPNRVSLHQELQGSNFHSRVEFC
jgi:hypothetical protein